MCYNRYSFIVCGKGSRMEFEIAICDDCRADREFLIRQILKNKTVGKKSHIHEYASGWDLLEAMKEIAFAVIFLDIQMDGMNGEETARAVREMDSALVLVFYTGYAGPSPVSFEVQPYRYMMKNMPEEQIQSYLEAIADKMLENSHRPVLAAHIGKSQIFIRAEHILYIEKYKRSLRLHMIGQAYSFYGMTQNPDGTYPDIRLSGKLSELYEKLKKYGFAWPHDSYVINCDHLCFCDADTFRLAETEGIFHIARSKAKTFRAQKDRFLCSKYV